MKNSNLSILINNYYLQSKNSTIVKYFLNKYSTKLVNDVKLFNYNKKDASLKNNNQDNSSLGLLTNTKYSNYFVLDIDELNGFTQISYISSGKNIIIKDKDTIEIAFNNFLQEAIINMYGPIIKRIDIVVSSIKKPQNRLSFLKWNSDNKTNTLIKILYGEMIEFTNDELGLRNLLALLDAKLHIYVKLNDYYDITPIYEYFMFNQSHIICSNFLKMLLARNYVNIRIGEKPTEKVNNININTIISSGNNSYGIKHSEYAIHCKELHTYPYVLQSITFKNNIQTKTDNSDNLIQYLFDKPKKQNTKINIR